MSEAPEDWEFLRLCSEGSLKELQAYMAKHQCLVNDPRLGRVRPLGEAVCDNTLDVVKFLVSKGAQLHFEADGSTPLSLAIVNNKPDILAWLIAQGCNVNHVSGLHRSTVLYTAFNCGMPEMAKTLIKAGARITPDLARVLDERAKRRGGKSSPTDDQLRALLPS
jgi:ankyrin repeat protein